MAPRAHPPGPPGRAPVPEGLPEALDPSERRRARMRLVAQRRLGGLAVVLDGLHDPHNISAVLRSCEGFGVQCVHLIGAPGALPINRQITKGCHKWLSLRYHATAADCADALHAEGFALWAAMPDRTALNLEALDFSQRIALVFGAEKLGLSEALLARCDGRFVIPMAGFSQSLNVSVAAAISIYTAASRRRAAAGAPGDLTAEASDALAAEWIAADRARRLRGAPAPVVPPPETCDNS